MEKISPLARIDEYTASSVNINSVLKFTFPVLRENHSGWYIEFYAFDPARNCMRRKRMKVNRIHPIKARRQYCQLFISHLTQLLLGGWSPWIPQKSEVIIEFTEMCRKYELYSNKMFTDGYFRKGTNEHHIYSLRKLMKYNEQRKKPIKFLYEMDLRFCNDFLDWIYLEQNLSGIYRNAMLTFLRLLLNWCIERGYTSSNPANLIKPIPKRLLVKRRKLIPTDTIKEISKYLEIHNKHFLLSCYLLYYCFLRPIEQTRIKLSYFNLKRCTLTIPAVDSKNRKTQTITVPRKLIELALDLRVFDNPPDYYLFSENLEPGNIQIGRRWLSKQWEIVKKELKLDKDYTFYSLKDTGITEMIDNNVSNVAVRDQARHSSLQITNIYAKHSEKADTQIINIKGSL